MLSGGKNEMRKTCANCYYYHGTVGDLSPDKDWHFHDYCDLWKREIPSYTIFDRRGCRAGYDDIECGLAYCWAYEEADKEYPLEFKNMDDNDFYEDEEEDENES